MKFGRCLAFSMMAWIIFSSPVMAQDSAPESEKYDGGSFTIVPPAGWILVSGSLSPKEVQKLPENVREHYNLRNSDVIFMNLGSQNADTKGFKDSLNVVTVTEPIPLSESLVKELTTVIKQQYDSMFEKYEFESIEVIKLNDMDVLSVKGGYKVLNYNVKMEQVLVPSKNDSIVLTCTYDSGSKHAEESIGKCREAMKSLVLTN